MAGASMRAVVPQHGGPQRRILAMGDIFRMPADARTPISQKSFFPIFPLKEIRQRAAPR
jgi:hypothetical protein